MRQLTDAEAEAVREYFAAGGDGEDSDDTPELAVAAEDGDTDESDGEPLELDLSLDDVDLTDDESEEIELEEVPEEMAIDDEQIWERDVSDTRSDRDDRAESSEANATHEEVRSHLRESGDAEEIAEQLKDLSKEEVITHARSGGTLDMRNAVRRLAGDTSMKELYRRPTTESGDDLALCVSLDMSNSMTPDELDAKAGVGGFLHGVQEHTEHEVAANAWHESVNEAVVRLITGPHEPFRWSHLDAVWPDGGTPTAAGIDEASILLEQMRAEIRILVVITDGTPSTLSWQPEEYDDPVAESQAVVDEVRDRGIEVIGLGFGAVSEDRMTEIFGDAGRAVTVSTLPDHLMDILEDHINT